MKTIEKNLWYGGKSGAVTFSYDDGRIEDIRLVETFNKYGVKGTFHLCDPDFDTCHQQYGRYILMAKSIDKVKVSSYNT